MRKAPGDSPHPPRFIETVSGAGYRLVAPVTLLQTAANDWNGTHPRSTDPSIHELIGRGRFHLLSASMREIGKAVSGFESAIEIDPGYAAAHAALALAHCVQAELRCAPSAQAYEHARGAALRALAMDNCSADAQVALGRRPFSCRNLDRHMAENIRHAQAYVCGAPGPLCGLP